MILLHLIAWTIFIFYPFIFFRIQVFGNAFYYKQIINAFFLAAVFYFSFYYLFPRLIKKIKLIKNVLLLFSLIIFIPLQQYMLEYSLFNRIEENHVQIISPLSKAKIAEFSAPSTRKEIRVIVHRDSITQDRFFKIPLPAHTLFFNETLQTSVSSVLFILLVSGFLSVAGEFFKTDKKRKELENKRLNAELAFLKSQVNPHFFFNTLNTIYFLAHKKSDQTEHVVVKLSEIMRYMIYESNASEVSLNREIKYLSDYIDLQKMRLSKKVEVKFNVHGDAGNLLIAPMMLIPFIENAFKHGISYAEESFVFIEIMILDSELAFITRNRIFSKKEITEETSGVGLENVRKRLALLYPDRHRLIIDQHNKEFIVDLNIRLKND
ncbi:MAG: histidine kinase [Bacteroidetes bacterium]|nr:histidine kinase [Bacteroidota bacterium]